MAIYIIYMSSENNLHTLLEKCIEIFSKTFLILMKLISKVITNYVCFICII